MNCKICGSPTKYREGYSKAKNKPWKGYFCSNKDCSNVEWLPTSNTPSRGQNGSKGANFAIEEGIKMILEEIQGLREELVKKNTTFPQREEDSIL